MNYKKKKREEKKGLDKEAAKIEQSFGNDIDLPNYKENSMHVNSTDPIRIDQSNSTLSSPPPPPEEPSPRELKSYLCIFEEDDGDYDDDAYDDLPPELTKISKRKISLVAVFETVIFVGTILLLYFLYDVMSKSLCRLIKT